MKEPKWILEDAIKTIHGMLLSAHGGGEGVRDITLLESALNRAPQKFAYQDTATLFELAAAYSFGIAKNHPFVDGNKRTAFMAGVIFLEINGHNFTAPEAESANLFEGLAAGKVSEAELSIWYENNTEKN